VARFFRSVADLRSWFESNHATAPELWIGFYKAHTGRAGVQYPQAVEEALCFGWIDTTVRRLDEDRYTNRFVPRKSDSAWSRVNRAKFRELVRQGRVVAAGHAAFRRRPWTAYAYEQAPRALTPAYERRFRADDAAWEYFSRQPPGYRRLAVFWVMNAKRSETQERRLVHLIAASAQQRRPTPFVVASADRRAEVRPPSGTAASD
jgi:uncharacterized protein YdeI (YjbR/CyaY-like superfamily)